MSVVFLEDYVCCGIFDPRPSTNQSTSLKSGSLFLVMVSVCPCVCNVRTYKTKQPDQRVKPLFKLVLWLVLGRGSLYDSSLVGRLCLLQNRTSFLFYFPTFFSLSYFTILQFLRFRFWSKITPFSYAWNKNCCFSLLLFYPTATAAEWRLGKETKKCGNGWNYCFW